jgi:hypothetical protein
LFPQVKGLAVVDVGGDAVARGGEEGLRSPLADALTLAGASESGVPFDLYVIGPGADGELSAPEVLQRLSDASAQQLGGLSEVDAHAVASIQEWHPTEATTIVAEAARGLRGTVETRALGSLVLMDDDTPTVWRLSAEQVAALPLVHVVSDSSSLS